MEKFIKKLLVIFSVLHATSSLMAEMRRDSVTGHIYSHPESRNINQDDYAAFGLTCLIKILCYEMNSDKSLSHKKFIKECSRFLKSIGTPTALRLLSDIKKNKIYDENGCFIEEIY